MGSSFIEGTIIEDATGERILGYPWSGVFSEINDIMERTVRIVNAHDDLVALVREAEDAQTPERHGVLGREWHARCRKLLASLEPNAEEANDA